MFFGVGYKEHLVVVESAPYGEGMFAGGVEVLSVGAESKIAMLMGDKTELAIAMSTWDKGITEVGELFLHADVAMLMDDPFKPMHQAPALYMAEQGQVKCIPNDEEKPYSLCYPGDETHALMVELSKAIQDYEKHADKGPQAVTHHVATFIVENFNLSADAQIRYLNFKTGDVFGVIHAEPTVN